MSEQAPEPQVIVFTCNWQAYNGLEAAGAGRAHYPASVRPLKVMCLGRLSAGIILKAFEKGADGIILKAFEKGADGVLLLGCPPGECHYEFGNRRAEEVFVCRGQRDGGPARLSGRATQIGVAGGR